MVKKAGIVEGFYWTKEDQVNGQYKEFNYQKRIDLLEFMGKKNLNFYVYDPKLIRGDNYASAYTPFSKEKKQGWKNTLRIANKNSIHFSWGLALGRSEIWKEKSLYYKIEEVLDLGSSGITLLFDDVPGGATEGQKYEQVKLTKDIKDRFGYVIDGFCPGNYGGEPGPLEKELSVLHEGISKDVPFILTAYRVWSKNLEYEDFPSLKDRGIIFWDNWMASDTSKPERLVVKPIKGRSRELFDKLDGYILNPCFPVERIIPVVSSVGKVINNKLSLYQELDDWFDKESVSWVEQGYIISGLLDDVANDWSEFLGVEKDPLRKLLQRDIVNDKIRIEPKEYARIAQKWPSLGPIFER